MSNNQIIKISYTSAVRDGKARFTSEAQFRAWLAKHPEVRQYKILRNMK